MAELRSCPWCGKKPVIDERHDTFQVTHECEGPWGVEIKTKLCWTEESAVAAWNRRARMNTFHPTIEFKKVNPDAPTPKKAHPTDAAYDLCAMEDVTLMPGEWKMVGSGIAMAIPEGYCGMVYPRSGLGCKGLVLKNTVGVIDSAYRGEIKLTLFNNNPTHVWMHRESSVLGTNTTEIVPNKDVVIHVHKGDRVAQLRIELVPDTELVEVEELPDSDRGEGSFGSTGVHERL